MLIKTREVEVKKKIRITVVINAKIMSIMEKHVCVLCQHIKGKFSSEKMGAKIVHALAVQKKIWR